MMVTIEGRTITGLYVSVNFTDRTNTELAAFQQRYKIPTPEPTRFHATVVYSKAPIFWRPELELDQIAKPKHWTAWEWKGVRHLVLLIDCPYLHTRWKLACNRGAVVDHEEYRPHITFASGIDESFDPKSLPLPDFDIELKEEIAKPLFDKWD